MPAAYPGSVKTYTTKVNGVDAPDAEHINDLQLEVAAVETDLLKAHTNYSETSTIVGWSSFTNKYITYLKLGKLVFVVFYIAGVSNNATTTFTLPFTSGMGVLLNAVIRAGNNGGVSVPGLVSLSHESNVATLYATAAAGAFTASGTKFVLGEFFYFTG